MCLPNKNAIIIFFFIKKRRFLTSIVNDLNHQISFEGKGIKETFYFREPKILMDKFVTIFFSNFEATPIIACKKEIKNNKI